MKEARKIEIPSQSNKDGKLVRREGSDSSRERQSSKTRIALWWEREARLS